MSPGDCSRETWDGVECAASAGPPHSYVKEKCSDVKVVLSERTAARPEGAGAPFPWHCHCLPTEQVLLKPTLTLPSLQLPWERQWQMAASSLSLGWSFLLLRSSAALAPQQIWPLPGPFHGVGCSERPSECAGIGCTVLARFRVRPGR